LLLEEEERMSDQITSSEDPAPGLIKSTQEFGAGLFLIAVAAFFYWQGLDLPRGTLRAMGPGMLPMALTVMVGIGGLLMVFYSFFELGPRLERWSLRGPFFIFGGIIVFALLIRTCGLIVAGPASMIFAMRASDEFEWKEATVFSIAMTIICILLFKTLLRLPIPVIGTVLEPYFPF
jgi:putative tricarboxylic transport membrane protein